MKIHHKVIFTLKILFLLLFVLVQVKIIPSDTPFQTIIDDTFKILLGIFVLYVSFPWRKCLYEIEGEDYLFLFMTGIIFLLSLDYKKYINSYKQFFKRLRERSIKQHINDKDQ